MKARNVILLPLFASLLLSSCGNVKYTPIETIKYAAKQLRESYEQLPNPKYYLTWKEYYSGATIDSVKESFPTLLPKEFVLKTDWFADSSVTIDEMWHCLYEGKYSYAEGEVYWRSDESGRYIQLWVVTYPLSETPDL